MINTSLATQSKKLLGILGYALLPLRSGLGKKIYLAKTARHIGVKLLVIMSRQLKSFHLHPSIIFWTKKTSTYWGGFQNVPVMPVIPRAFFA